MRGRFFGCGRVNRINAVFIAAKPEPEVSVFGYVPRVPSANVAQGLGAKMRYYGANATSQLTRITLTSLYELQTVSH